MLKVEGQSELFKQGPAVLNTDRRAYERAKQKKAEKLAEKQRIDNIENKLDRLTDLVERLLDK